VRDGFLQYSGRNDQRKGFSWSLDYRQMNVGFASYLSGAQSSACKTGDWTLNIPPTIVLQIESL
jgi:hypothetical protein